MVIIIASNNFRASCFFIFLTVFVFLVTEMIGLAKIFFVSDDNFFPTQKISQFGIQSKTNRTVFRNSYRGSTIVDDSIFRLVLSIPLESKDDPSTFGQSSLKIYSIEISQDINTRYKILKLSHELEIDGEIYLDRIIHESSTYLFATRIFSKNNHPSVSYTIYILSLLDDCTLKKINFNGTTKITAFDYRFGRLHISRSPDKYSFVVVDIEEEEEDSTTKIELENPLNGFERTNRIKKNNVFSLNFFRNYTSINNNNNKNKNMKKKNKEEEEDLTTSSSFYYSNEWVQFVHVVDEQYRGDGSINDYEIKSSIVLQYSRLLEQQQEQEKEEEEEERFDVSRAEYPLTNEETSVITESSRFGEFVVISTVYSKQLIFFDWKSLRAISRTLDSSTYGRNNNNNNNEENSYYDYYFFYNNNNNNEKEKKEYSSSNIIIPRKPKFSFFDSHINKETGEIIAGKYFYVIYGDNRILFFVFDQIKRTYYFLFSVDPKGIKIVSDCIFHNGKLIIIGIKGEIYSCDITENLKRFGEEYYNFNNNNSEIKEEEEIEKRTNNDFDDFVEPYSALEYFFRKDVLIIFVLFIFGLVVLNELGIRRAYRRNQQLQQQQQ